jgi:hypothetical protein
MEVLRSEYFLQEADTCSRTSAVYCKNRATRREEAVHTCDDRRWCGHRVYQRGVYVCSDQAQVICVCKSNVTALSSDAKQGDDLQT